MTTPISATFSVKSWDEKPYLESEGGRKLTRAHVVFTYAGELDGEGMVEYLMTYSPDGSGTFVGLEHFTGRLGARAGTFVVQHSGTFAGHGIRDAWTIAPGSATGDLQGLTGGGHFAIEGQGPYSFTFNHAI